MSKQPPPAPTARAIGPCPTIIQISRTPQHWKFTQHLRTTRPPPRTLELDNGFYCGNFRPYWQPRYQPHRPSVYVMQVPVPVQLVRKDGIQTFSIGDLNFYGKSKSKATRIRDKIRKQSFLENKTLCLALPFYGLEAEAFRSEMARKEDGKEVSKLKSASKTIQELQMVNEKLNFTINSLQCRFTEERKKKRRNEIKIAKAGRGTN